MNTILKEALEVVIEEQEVTTSYPEKRCYKSIAQNIKALKVLERIPADFPVRPVMLQDGVVLFLTHSTEELHDVRQALRKVFGTWSDKISAVWQGSGTNEMIASYRNETQIAIWMYFKVDDVPEGVLSPNCHIEKETVEETNYSVVCEVPEA